jgi:dTMP kinase
MSGLFISFEGGEGGGKTTQINRLAEILTAAGHKVITTREPGGTPESEKIRDFIVQRKGGDWSPMAECLLLFAARTMLVDKVIKPALSDGKVVISDRFTDSTRAYQGYGRGFDLAQIEQLNDIVLSGFAPDLTFVLDIDPETGLERSGRRLAAEALDVQQTEDKFERLGTDFHAKIRQGFLDIANKAPERCHVIESAQSVDEMADAIKTIVLERLGA